MTNHDNPPGQPPVNPELSLLSGREPGQANWMAVGKPGAGKTLLQLQLTIMKTFLSRERDDE